MSPQQFLQKWAPNIPHKDYPSFMLDFWRMVRFVKKEQEKESIQFPRGEGG